jgi:hypothetical protein
VTGIQAQKATAKMKEDLKFIIARYNVVYFVPSFDKWI